jgi:hypothetical protein
MTEVIAEVSVRDYLAEMRLIMLRLIALIAVVLMPLGMQPSTAAPSHHAISASMPIQHCPDSNDGHQMKGGIAECTMACAGALPAAELLRGELPLIACVPLQPVLAQRLQGLHPDTATPPPKLS